MVNSQKKSGMRWHSNDLTLVGHDRYMNAAEYAVSDDVDFGGDQFLKLPHIQTRY